MDDDSQIQEIVILSESDDEFPPTPGNDSRESGDWLRGLISVEDVPRNSTILPHEFSNVSTLAKCDVTKTGAQVS